MKRRVEQLPDSLTPAFLTELLSPLPGEEGFIGERAKGFSADDKLRLRKQAELIGGPVYRLYRLAARNWAAVLNRDNVWHLEDFENVYQADINCGWAQSVIVTSVNVRFVTTDSGVFTFPEFKHYFGTDVVEYITQWQEQVQLRLETVKQHITADLLRRKALVMNTDGALLTMSVIGLQMGEQVDWCLPAGYQLVDLTD